MGTSFLRIRFRAYLFTKRLRKWKLAESQLSCSLRKNDGKAGGGGGGGKLAESQLSSSLRKNDGKAGGGGLD